MVENGIESYFRWQVSCVTFIRWPGIFESVLNEHVQIIFVNFFSDGKIVNDKLAVLPLSGGQVYLNLFRMNMCRLFFVNFFSDGNIVNDNNDVVF